MPSGSMSMAKAYNESIDGSDNTNAATNSDTLKTARSKLKDLRNSNAIDYTAYTRTAYNEINNQFPVLPNPSIVMYIYPHDIGTGYNLSPVPGYSTVFPLYQNVYYAMPGELLASR
jgi:conjugative transfer region lipoprotein (TIGR03751 family)